MQAFGGQTLLKNGGVYYSPQIPDGYLYNNDVVPSITGKSELTRVTPATGNSSGPGQLIRFQLPNNGFADMRYAVLLLTASASQTGGTFCRFSQLINTMIKKIRITAGAKEICDVNDYNLICSWIFWSFISQETVTNIGPLLGYDTTTNRNTNAAGREYLVPLFLDCLTSKPWPLKLMDDILTVELTLDTAVNCLEFDGTSPTFSVTNIEWQIPIFEPNQSYLDAIGPSLCWKFANITCVKQSLTAASGDLQISEKTSCLNHIVALQRVAANTTGGANLDKFLTWTYSNNTSYQVRHKGHYHPPQPVDCTTVAVGAWYHFLNSISSWSFFNATGNNTGFSQTTPTLFTSTRFQMHVNLEVFPHSALISGSDVVGSTDNIVFNITLSATPGSALEVDFLCISDYLICLNNGKLSITR